MNSLKRDLLLGKRVLLTGGSRGLGRAMCLEFVRQGAKVAFNYSQNEAGAVIFVLIRAHPILHPEENKSRITTC